MAKRNSLDMTQGPVLRKLLLFAYPLILSSLISGLYNAVDKAIAGQFIGPSAMAAVGASTSPISLLTNIFSGIGTGVAVLCGNFIGAKREKELRQCIHTAPIAGFLCGVIVAILGCCLTGTILHSTGVPADVYNDARSYMILYLLGSPIAVAETFCVYLFSAYGDTKRVTVAGVIGGLLNVIGNLFFVIMIPLGVIGIAIATLLSQVLSLSIKLYIMFDPKDNYRLRFSELRLHWNHTKSIFSIGIPTGLSSSAFSLANVILQSSVNSFGSVVIAGNSAADSLTNFAIPVAFQMGAAISCAVAQCHGAHKFDRMDETIKKGLLGSLCMVIAVSTLMTVFRRPLMNLFTDDSAVAIAGIPKMLFVVWGNIPYAIAQGFFGGLKGLQKTSTMMFMSLAGICLPRILWVWFIFPFFATPTILYLIMPISNTICAILSVLAYRHHRRQLA